jgi:hypothetical protein
MTVSKSYAPTIINQPASGVGSPQIYKPTGADPIITTIATAGAGETVPIMQAVPIDSLDGISAQMDLTDISQTCTVKFRVGVAIVALTKDVDTTQAYEDLVCYPATIATYGMIAGPQAAGKIPLQGYGQVVIIPPSSVTAKVAKCWFKAEYVKSVG